MVHCGKCGVELLGAVNRCWKCGQPVVSRHDASTLPPVRRPPVSGPLDALPWSPLAAQIVDEAPTAEAAPPVPAAVGGVTAPSAATSAASPASANTAAVAAGAPANAVSPSIASPRRGSPFRTGTTLKRSVAPAPAASAATASAWNYGGHVQEAARPPSVIARLAPLIALVLGAASLALGDFPEVALGFAVLGLGFAVVGLMSRQSAMAIVATVLCILSLLWSSYQTAVAVYVRRFGVSPWVNSDDDFVPVDLPDDGQDRTKL